jgi:uncharacterized protein (TIGR00369 family)
VSAPPISYQPQGFNETIGLESVQIDGEEMRGTCPVTDALKQPMGLVHGGVFASIAETLASFGTFVFVYEDGNAASGMSNNTTFMRPILEGTIHAVARPRHRGRTTWVWDVEMSDDQDRVCALSRVTIAVRPAR